MKLNEIIDLSKPFEKKLDKEKNIVTGLQLYKYFTLDDIKITKKKEKVEFHIIYKHKISSELIDILWFSMNDNEKSLYRNYSNTDIIKHFTGIKKLPHGVEDLFQQYQQWEFDILKGERDEIK